MGMLQAPTQGWMEGRVHHYPLRVFYEDTDFTGIVYYANYLRFIIPTYGTGMTRWPLLFVRLILSIKNLPALMIA